jgi:putative transcriptional regulator
VSSNLKNRLRELRQAGEGMTQQQLADSVGVSRQTIISIESGRYSPSLELAIKISEQLEQDITEIFWIEN